MGEHVTRIVEVVGTSTDSIEKAISHAVEETAKTMPEVGWFQLVELRGHVSNGKVARYQALLKIGAVEEG